MYPYHKQLACVFKASVKLVYSQHKRLMCLYHKQLTSVFATQACRLRIRRVLLADLECGTGNHACMVVPLSVIASSPIGKQSTTRQTAKTAASRSFLPGRTIVRRAGGKHRVFHLPLSLELSSVGIRPAFCAFLLSPGSLAKQPPTCDKTAFALGGCSYGF